MSERRANFLAVQHWNRFWFQPVPVDTVAGVRGLLCLLTAIYFLSAWFDAAFWYGEGGRQAASRIHSFLITAGVQDEAQWILSPLFLSESLWLYRAYLLLGVGLSVAVAAGKGGRAAGWLLWLVVVGWANRAMLLAGLSETLLSLGLFACAIAPPAPGWIAWRGAEGTGSRIDWTAGLAQKLVGVQVTAMGLATFATMLAGNIWWNGFGAVALAGPVERRTIDWSDSALVQPLVHDMLTHFLVLALPVGFTMVWNRGVVAAGRTILCLWCLAIALLGSYWLYAATFAVMMLAIRPGWPAGGSAGERHVTDDATRVR